jgi:hypothetical protein
MRVAADQAGGTRRVGLGRTKIGPRRGIILAAPTLSDLGKQFLDIPVSPPHASLITVIASGGRTNAWRSPGEAIPTILLQAESAQLRRFAPSP